jgi:type IV secretory pathway VirB10-like protein
LLCRQSAVATALPIRSFTTSTWSSSPTASDKKPAKKTTTSTSTKKATGTTTATKSKSKDKAKAKPKAKAAEEKPKKPKKVVDPEKLKRLEIRELKKWTLKDKPAQLPATTWLLYMFEQRGNHLGAGGILQQAKEMAEKFRQLDTSEIDVCSCRISLTF